MSPFHLSETPNDLVKASPCLGEDNEYVCTQLLGLSDEKFLELLKENIFE
jgi:benzylsuccinate CoA-transferase BbsF subunit